MRSSHTEAERIPPRNGVNPRPLPNAREGGSLFSLRINEDAVNARQGARWRKNRIGASRLLKIGGVLGVPIDYFFTESDNLDPKSTPGAFDLLLAYAAIKDEAAREAVLRCAQNPGNHRLRKSRRSLPALFSIGWMRLARRLQNYSL